ncbi:Uma2 family endonuclease [Streptomyces sp. NBC_00237]|uniref:Uma2 family endonuclease n=1 Tax=Streptomyces sp. NBC_00237 TaxID=2975687 RepID=UPI0022505159|nr:Uma2 family endonuclease [Streptomyces sp. NBC_00237]MCX5200315.1 Uma2 family endonuclease [Streptomyces sp. NBC_00237]
MTVMAERAVQMSPEEFEGIAKTLERETDAVRLEFINGRIGFRSMPDGDHNEIVEWLRAVCMQHKPGWALYGPDQGLKVGSYRKGRVRPDGSLAPRKNFAGHGDWADPAGVLMTVEVTSYDSDTNNRDRVEKPAAYAAAGIPVYLLIDRDSCKVSVFSRPDQESGKYRDVHSVAFGLPITIPEPVGIELDTEELKDYVR